MLLDARDRDLRRQIALVEDDEPRGAPSGTQKVQILIAQRLAPVEDQYRQVGNLPCFFSSGYALPFDEIVVVPPAGSIDDGCCYPADVERFGDEVSSGPRDRRDDRTI